MDNQYKHQLIIPKVEMEPNIQDSNKINNKELIDETESECYYKVVNESVISSNDNNHEIDFEDSDDDENEDEIEDENQVDESTTYFNENHINTTNQNILNKNSNKFYSLNRTKLVKSATIIRNETDQFEIDNSQALSFIHKFSRKQRTKMEEMLPKVELKNYCKNVISSSKFYTDNERLGKLLESKNLRNKHKARSVSNLEEYSGLFEDDLIDDRNESVYTADLNLNRISLLDSRQRDITFKKLNNRTESINFKKYVVNSMYKKSLDNQRKSKRYSANSLEKSIINNEQNRISKKSIRYLDDETSRDQSNLQIVSTADTDMKRINKVIENNLNLVGNGNDVINKKMPDDYFQFKIATNKYNSKFEIFKP